MAAAEEERKGKGKAVAKAAGKGKGLPLPAHLQPGEATTPGGLRKCFDYQDGKCNGKPGEQCSKGFGTSAQPRVAMGPTAGSTAENANFDKHLPPRPRNKPLPLPL